MSPVQLIRRVAVRHQRTSQRPSTTSSGLIAIGMQNAVENATGYGRRACGGRALTIARRAAIVIASSPSQQAPLPDKRQLPNAAKKVQVHLVHRVASLGQNHPIRLGPRIHLAPAGKAHRHKVHRLAGPVRSSNALSMCVHGSVYQERGS